MDASTSLRRRAAVANRAERCSPFVAKRMQFYVGDERAVVAGAPRKLSLAPIQREKVDRAADEDRVERS